MAAGLKSNTSITQVRLCLYVHANSKSCGASARFAILHVRKVLLSKRFQLQHSSPIHYVHSIGTVLYFVCCLFVTTLDTL